MGKRELQNLRGKLKHLPAIVGIRLRRFCHGVLAAAAFEAASRRETTPSFPPSFLPFEGVWLDLSSLSLMGLANNFLKSEQRRAEGYANDEVRGTRTARGLTSERSQQPKNCLVGPSRGISPWRRSHWIHFPQLYSPRSQPVWDCNLIAAEMHL